MKRGIPKDWRSQVDAAVRDEVPIRAPTTNEPEKFVPMSTKQRNGFLRRLAVVQREWNTFTEAAAEHRELLPVVTDVQAALLRARAQIAADQPTKPRRDDAGDQQHDATSRDQRRRKERRDEEE